MVIICEALMCWRLMKTGKVRQTTVHKFPSPTITRMASAKSSISNWTSGTSAEPQVVKHKANSVLLTPLEERMVVAKKVNESFAQAKGPLDARTTSPKVDKPSSVWDTYVSDQLMTSFLSSLFICTKLAIQNSFVVALSSVQLKELEKKNVDLIGMLLTEQARHETKMSDLKKSMFVPKSSLAKKIANLTLLLLPCMSKKRLTSVSSITC
ncbi:unnamed protein product [Prunus armeniaca]